MHACTEELIHTLPQQTLIIIMEHFAKQWTKERKKIKNALLDTGISVRVFQEE